MARMDVHPSDFTAWHAEQTKRIAQLGMGIFQLQYRPATSSCRLQVSSTRAHVGQRHKIITKHKIIYKSDSTLLHNRNRNRDTVI